MMQVLTLTTPVGGGVQRDELDAGHGHGGLVEFGAWEIG